MHMAVEGVGGLSSFQSVWSLGFVFVFFLSFFFVFFNKVVWWPIRSSVKTLLVTVEVRRKETQLVPDVPYQLW